MALFAIGDRVGHRTGDLKCPECAEEYPEPCRCGGLMHAAAAEAEDEEGDVVVATQCDQCGRSEDQLDEI